MANRKIELVAVVGVYDLVHGDNVRAYVKLIPDEQATSQELIQFTRQRVGYKVPEEIVFLDEIPMNATGKVDRNRLKQLAEGAT